MKKILLTTSTLPLSHGDSEAAFVLNLAIALTERYAVTVLAPAGPGAQLHENVQGVDIIRYRYAPLRRWETLAYPGAILARLQHQPLYWTMVPMLVGGLYLALRKLLKQQAFDLVHCHWFAPQATVQAFGFSGPSYPPFVVTSHGGDLSGLHGPLIDAIYRRVIDKSAAVTVVSQRLREQVKEQAPDALVTPMGVDTHAFISEGTRESPHVPTLLFVGRLVEKKGVTYLLEALASERLKNLDFKATIIGDGPEKPALEQQLHDLSLRDKVQLLGAVRHDDLPAHYAAADIFCAPSVVAANGDIDGLPTVILEAAAAGAPCVSTLVGGIPDFVRNGENGLLVEPANAAALARAIEKILLDDSLRERLSATAAKDALEFDWRIISARFAAIYENCLSHPDGAP